MTELEETLLEENEKLEREREEERMEFLMMQKRLTNALESVLDGQEQILTALKTPPKVEEKSNEEAELIEELLGYLKASKELFTRLEEKL